MLPLILPEYVIYAFDALCRHSVGGKKVKKISCLACATEMSQMKNFDASIIDDYLQSNGMKRVSVPADGHCILHSWQMGLTEVNTEMNHEKLLQVGMAEIANNLHFYSDFLPNEDLLSQLQAYATHHNYLNTVVDLMVHSLASATCTTCVILSAPQGVVRKTLIEPREGIKSTATIYLCKLGMHYDAVLKVSTEVPLTTGEQMLHIMYIVSGGSLSCIIIFLPFVYFSAIECSYDFSSPLESCNSQNFTIMTQNRFSSLPCTGEENDPITIMSDTSDDEVVICSGSQSYTESLEEPQSPISDGKTSNLESSCDSHEETTDNYSHAISEPIDGLKLPFDIDGNVSYRLPYDPEKRMKSSLDGRPWKTWVTTSKKGFGGIRRLAHCKGSYKCFNTNCSFRKQYQRANRAQFERREGETVCKCCGLRASLIACHACKVWEFPRNSKCVYIIHSGKHTCVPKQRQDASKLKEAFLANPNLRPRQAAIHSAVNALKTGKGWEEVIDVTDRFIDTNKVKNAKQKVRQEMHPSGINFEAVGELKAKVTERDPYYVCCVNDRKLNGQASYVFKTSKIQASLALSMDKDGEGVLNNEYCFLDIKHNRCAGFKTFSIHVYHPMLRRLVTLATMECEDETTKTLTKFWLLF